MKKILLLIFIPLCLAFPKEAWMSGPFTGYWADKFFLISFEEAGHKIFQDNQQATEYMNSYNQAFLGKIFLSQPARVKLLEKALKKSITLLPMNPGLPSEPPYPCCRTFSLDSDRGTYRVTVCLQKTLSQGQEHWLAQELAAALGKSPVSYEPPETPLPALQTVEAFALREAYGVYASMDHQIQSENMAQYQTAIEQTLVNLQKHLDQALSDPTFRKAMDCEPLPLKPVFDQARQAGYAPAAIFRPHGPSLDDTFPTLVSIRGQKGAVRLVVMFNLKKFNWGLVSMPVDKVLAEFAAEH